MCAQVGEYLRDWHRCAACKGSRQQDQLEEALNLSPGFFHSALASWISTASLKESEAAPPRPHARAMEHQSLAWMWQYSPDHEITSTKFVVCVCLVSEFCSTPCNPMAVAHQAPLSKGKLQARILQWVAMPSSRGSSHLTDWTQVSRTTGRLFTVWVTREC